MTERKLAEKLRTAEKTIGNINRDKYKVKVQISNNGNNTIISEAKKIIIDPSNNTIVISN